MPVVTTPVKNHPSKRASLARTARVQASVSSCMCPSLPGRTDRHSQVSDMVLRGPGRAAGELVPAGSAAADGLAARVEGVELPAVLLVDVLAAHLHARGQLPLLHGKVPLQDGEAFDLLPPVEAQVELVDVALDHVAALGRGDDLAVGPPG